MAIMLGRVCLQHVHCVQYPAPMPRTHSTSKGKSKYLGVLKLKISYRLHLDCKGLNCLAWGPHTRTRNTVSDCTLTCRTVESAFMYCAGAMVMKSMHASQPVRGFNVQPMFRNYSLYLSCDAYAFTSLILQESSDLKN